MKRTPLIRLLVIALALPGAAAFGQAAGGQSSGQATVASSLRFDEQTWDFGTIKETGGKVSHNFGFTNTGTTPVVVESVEASCGCTTPSFSRAPVMPGKTGSITVTYDPMNRPGTFLKDILVKSGNGRSVDNLKIKGTVTPRPRTVEDDYPFELAGGIRLTGDYLNFERVGQGQAKSMTIGYINTSRRQVELKIADPDANPWFRVTSPGRVCAGCKGEITLTFDLTHTTAWGTLAAHPLIYVDGVRNGINLLAAAVATDNFDGVDVATAARSKLDLMFFHFGDVAAGDKPLSHRFTLENTGGAPLFIRAVQCGQGATSTLKEGTKVEPGRSITFTISISLLPDGPLAGRVSRSVILVTNDPLRPTREIRLVANVK